MAYQVINASDVRSVLERVIDSLSVMLEGDEPVDIITFAEDPKYLGRKLFPRQRLFLKLYYGVSLTDEELEDAKYLLSCQNKYAKLYFPGLCEHHIIGYCTKEACHLSENMHDLDILSDEEIRRRLENHKAHILLLIVGRRGTKSSVGAIINLYEIYKFKRISNPQEKYGLWPGSRIGTLNVAVDEKQAQILFDYIKLLIDNSPWFQKLKIRSLETQIEFGGGVYSRSLHSNSSSVRGNTAICINIDEICWLNKTLGKFSDRSMIAATAPSTILFKDDKRIVMGSSPGNQEGVAWDYAQAAVERKTPHIIYFQGASWEMNPNASRENDSEVQHAYLMDPDAAEMEYGGQWAAAGGAFIPDDAIKVCANKDLGNKTHGDKSIRYTISCDLSKKRDRCGIIVCHYDKEKGKVIVDRIEQFDPKNPFDDMVVDTKHGEIDIDLIEKHIRMLSDQFKFRFNSITFDQFNSQGIIQRLRAKFGEDVVEEFNWNDRTNREVYSNLRTQIVQGGIEYPQSHELMRQLAGLYRVIKQDKAAWKVEALPGQHDDLADPLAIATYLCLLNALGLTSGVYGIQNSVAPTAQEPASTFLALKHHKDCRDWYCVWGCPVQAAIQQGQQAQETTT